MSKPTFFFSHARIDRDPYLDEFFDNLDERLARFSGEGPELGTIDRDVLQGEDWDKALSGPLGSKRALVVIYTPTFFKRENCGKEVYGFLLRSPGLGIDTNGALTGADNIVPVRWYRQEVYTVSGESLVPPFLRLLSDRPAAARGNQALRQAIEVYASIGMEKCVGNEPHYGELLDAIVLRIRDMKDLAAKAGLRFATLKDAFKHDWSNHFAEAGAQAMPAAATMPASPAPRPLQSAVVFYVTCRPFTPGATAVDFADQVIAEPLPGTPRETDPSLAALLADVRAASAAEQLTPFHVATRPAVPASAQDLLKRLDELSNRHIPTALCVDASIWPGDPGSAAAGVIEQVVKSPTWTGFVFVVPEAGPDEIGNVTGQAARPHVMRLPTASADRVSALRAAFVDLRGTLLAASTDAAAGAERLPLLRGVGGSAR